MKLPDRGATRAPVIPNSTWATILLALSFHLARASHEPPQHDNDLLANLNSVYELGAGHQKQANNKPVSAMISMRPELDVIDEGVHNSSEFNYVSIIEHLYLELLDEFSSFRGALEGFHLAKELPVAKRQEQKSVLKRVHRTKRQTIRASRDAAKSLEVAGLLDEGKILQTTDATSEGPHETGPEAVYKLVGSRGAGLSNVTHLSMRGEPTTANTSLAEHENRGELRRARNEAPRAYANKRQKRVDSSHQELENELDIHLEETGDSVRNPPAQLEPDEPHEPVGIGGLEQQRQSTELNADSNQGENNRTQQDEIGQLNESGDAVELNSNHLASSTSIVREPDMSQKSAALLAETYEPSKHLLPVTVERVPHELELASHQDVPLVGQQRMPNRRPSGMHLGENSRRRELALLADSTENRHPIGEPQTGNGINKGGHRTFRRSSLSSSGTSSSGNQLLNNLASVSNQLSNEELTRLASLLSSNLPENQPNSSPLVQKQQQESNYYGPLVAMSALRPDANEQLFYDTQTNARGEDRRLTQQFLVRPSRTVTKQAESSYSANLNTNSQPAERKAKPSNGFWSQVARSKHAPSYADYQLAQLHASNRPQTVAFASSGSPKSSPLGLDDSKTLSHTNRLGANLIQASWLQQQRQADQVGAGPALAGQQANRPQSGYKLSPFAAAGTYLLPAFASVPYSSTTTARFGEVAASGIHRLGSAPSESSAGSIGRVGSYYDDSAHGPTSSSAHSTPRAQPHTDPMWSDTQNQEEDYKQSPQTIQITAVPNGLGLGNGLGLNGFNGWNGLNGWNGWNGPWNGRQVLLVNRQPQVGGSSGEWRQWILPVAVVLALPLVLGALFVPVFLKSVMFLIQILQMLGLLMPPGQMASQIGSSSHASG